MTWFVPSPSLITRILSKLRQGRIKEILKFLFGNQHITDQLYRTIVFSMNSLISKKGDILTGAGKTEFLPIIH